MVVDMELEDAKKNVLDLIKEKDALEMKLLELKNVLENNRVGMNDPLVDDQDYPRADVDVYQVRQARSAIICLQNDHKTLMRRIEAGLMKVHSLAGKGGEESAASQMTASGNIQDDDELPMEPFLRVNLVSSGSPAEQAGIALNDLVMEFGSINAQNFRSLKDIGDLVEQSRYKEIMVKVKRVDMKVVVLTLTPRPWAGKGLLGCNVIPLEAVER
ncbi:26S proteasome non-ATPase regulatory subunit 9 [Microplitis mediator]|uniref:26S proteasome non-ATPase regulatory subunit 9 n=1 Tax=Microplitis mediator TaxID=375433 RepID=UPI00255391D6|nr:26S proteasome non-ATPase regulatory subunit 9 [Microplitis mediator]